MSKLTDKINELASTEEKTVVVKRDDIENELRRIAEEKTVVDEKPVFLVCDNTVFVKKFPELSEIMNGSACGFPYDGAKESYILDIENDGLLEKVVPLLGEIVLLPKPKKKKQVL